MDAAQKLLKQIAILTTAVLLLSTVGLAATLVVPVTTVSIGAGGYVDASVTSSDATVITYVVGLPAYSGGDPAWLTVSPTGSTDTAATAGLRFTAHSVGLSAAVHSATVTLTPTAGATASVTITVTWDTSGGGGGTPPGAAVFSGIVITAPHSGHFALMPANDPVHQRQIGLLHGP